MFICSLHFEAKCFTGNAKKRLNFKEAQPSQGVKEADPPCAVIAPDCHPIVIVNNTSTHNSEPSSPALDKDEQIRYLEEQNRKLIEEVQKLSSENKVVKQQNYYLKRKCKSLDQTVKEFKEEVVKIQNEFNISQNVTTVLEKCASEVPAELFKSTAKRARGGRDKQYHPAIRKFALTLQLASSKAYRLREDTHNFFYWLNH